LEVAGKIATSKHPRYLDTLRPFSPNPMTPMMRRTPSHYCPKEAMNEWAWAWDFKWNILCPRVPWLGIWAWALGQTPWDSLEHLANLANVMSYTLHGFFEVPYYKPISFTISLSLIVQTNAKPKLIKQTNDQWKFKKRV
jgi:hypothetical protein